MMMGSLWSDLSKDMRQPDLPCFQEDDCGCGIKKRLEEDKLGRAVGVKTELETKNVSKMRLWSGQNSEKLPLG